MLPEAVSSLRAVPLPINSDSPEATMETIIMEPEKPQKDLIDQLSAEVDEIESHDRHVIVPIFFSRLDDSLPLLQTSCDAGFDELGGVNLLFAYERMPRNDKNEFTYHQDLYTTPQAHMGHLPVSRVRGLANTTRLFDTGKSQVGIPENAIIRIIRISYFHLFRTSFFFRNWAINLLQVIFFAQRICRYA